jgi:FecR protein
MTAPACPRSFEVAAARDGRLIGAELVSFQRHLGTCPSCRNEAEALEALAQASRALGGGERDELHVRRERTRLLAAFDRDLVAPKRRVSPWLWVAPASALCVALAVLWRTRAASPPPAPAPSIVAVRAESHALWSQRSHGNVDEVKLEDGAIAIHVDHTLAPTRKLLVVLPDGELEDIGTTFRVSVEQQHTMHVTVQDGSVLLRLRGSAPVTLGPGQSWGRELVAVPSLPTASPAPSAPLSLPPAKSTPRSAAPTSSRPALDAPARTSADKPDPALDFRAALALLNAGNPRQAAAAFSLFLGQHPGDPRAEDAAYLRVLALHQSGDLPATQQAAQRYLERYPAGFRHAEVERLSR